MTAKQFIEGKRYFYREPLEAAYQSKHHRMQFIQIATEHHVEEYGRTLGEEWDWLHSCSMEGGTVETIADALQFLEDASGKIFIHPDSLPILHPREGDVLQTKWGLSTVNEGMHQWNDHGHLDWISALEAKDEVENGAKIIQRAGKPFIMPEVEDEQGRT